MRRTGLSLLEVILAIAILAMSMAAVGELVRLGTERAELARDLTKAQLLCESKLSEIVVGAHPADPVMQLPFLTDPDWFYSVDLAATEDESLMALSVLVETHLERKYPIQFALTRWIPDPGIELPEEEEQPDDATDQPEEDDQPTGNSGNGGGNTPDGFGGQP